MKDRIIELRGEPLNDLRNLASADPDIEGVQAFGDRLHLCTKVGRARKVLLRLGKSARDDEAVIHKIEIVQPSLEDVFIALLEKDG